MTVYDVLFQVWWFVLGAVLGSFLNVVIHRLPRKESLIWPGSHCPSCGHLIRWYDNVPVLSWLFLRGRCRDCSATISPRYPLVEAMAALTVGGLAYAVSGGRWGALLSTGQGTWLAALFAPAILHLLIYATFFLTLMAAAAIAWDRAPCPPLLWLPAWVLALIGVVVGSKGHAGTAFRHLTLPMFSWFHWGLALVLGSINELLLSGWESNPGGNGPSSQKRSRKERRKKRQRAEVNPRDHEGQAEIERSRSVDFISFAGLAGILFAEESAVALVGGLLFLVVFIRAASLLSSSRQRPASDPSRVRAVLLGIAFVASWFAILLEMTR